MTRYTIRASCKTFAEYEVDESGKPTYEHHAFEGVELDGVKCYSVVDDYGVYVGEGLTFKQAGDLVEELSDKHAIS